MLPVVDTVQRGEVIRRQRDHNGRPVGLRNSNPILDTREYAVHQLFPKKMRASDIILQFTKLTLKQVMRPKYA